MKTHGQERAHTQRTLIWGCLSHSIKEDTQSLMQTPQKSQFTATEGWILGPQTY